MHRAFWIAAERKEFTDYAAGLGVGLKHNGLRPDAETDAYITDANLRIYQAGQYDPLALWGDRVPTGFEGAEGSYLVDRTATMWGLYNALDKHVDYLVLDTQLVSAPDRLDLLQFAAKYVGHTAADTPSAWVALRDSDPSADPKPWFPDYGNFEFWLYQNDAVPGGRTVPVWKVDKTAEGRYARRTDQASGNSSIYFDVDGDYVFGGNNVATVTVTYYDKGTDRWELRYDSSAGVDKLGGTVRKGNTLTWRKAVFLLRDAQFANRLPGGGTHPGSDLRIWSADDGNETIQFVDVEVRPSATKTFTLQPGVEDYDGVRDTYISQWEPASNFGGARSFWVGSRDAMAGLLRFDLARLPASARIVTATLEVYQYKRDGSAPLTLAAHRMLRPWDEFAATWQLAEAATSWQQPGASGLLDRDTLPSAATTIAQAAGWASIDITHIVQQWVTAAPGNEGLLLRGSSDGSVVYRFAASNYSVREQRPRLVIEYTDSTPRATRTPTPTRTSTPTSTLTPTASPTPTSTATSTITPTPTGTWEAPATATATVTASPTATSTASPTMTPTPAATPSSTATRPAVTATATATATSVPTGTVTPTPSRTPTATSTPVPSGRILGVVWLDEDRDGQRDPKEPGVATIPMALHRNNGAVWPPVLGEPYRRTVTDLLGEFEFSGLPVDRYVLTLPEPAGFVPTTPILVEVVLSESTATGDAVFGVTWYHGVTYLPLIYR